MTVEFITSSQEETIALGCTLGSLLREGDVLVLTGDLGAGKTQLTKGIARGMGVSGDVTSPTFTIEMVYEGERMPLYHFDLYRLVDTSELEDIGLYDVLGGDGPCVIEWGERFVDEIGPERVDVLISRLNGEGEGEAGAGIEPLRRIRLTAHDVRGEDLLRALEKSTDVE
mgnify:FL=1